MRFSVVIPLFNKARFIRRSLDSVLKQTLEKYEVIVVDDGSTDGGPDIVAQYDDHRIHLIQQENRGVSAARNRGIAESQGEWISFLDADDAWKPHYLQSIEALAEEYPDAGIYATAYEIIMPDGKVIHPKYSAIPPPPWQGVIPRYFRAALGHPPVWTSATTIPKQIFLKVGFFSVGIPVGEDIDMWGRIALRYSVAFSTAIGASYFQDDDLRHNRSRKHYLSTDPEAVFVKSANQAIQRGEIESVDLKDLYEYLSKIQVDLGRVCLFNDQNPVGARRILLNTYPKSLRFKWKKYRMLIQTYLPGLQLITRKVVNVLNRKRPIKYLVMRALKSTRLCILFRIEREDYSLRFYPSALSGELWYDPDLRVPDEYFFKRYLRSGDVVVDVGANIGELTLQAATSVGQSGYVIAIEAHPRIFKYLRGNVKLNRVKQVHLYNCAVGNCDGIIFFSDSKLDDGNAVVRSNNGLQICICRLDSLPIEASSIDLLKVDVEGFEKMVFEGAERILRKTKCIYFESWDEHFLRYDYCCNDLFAHLRRCGFTIFKMLTPDTITPISSDHHSNICENLVAIRERDDFLERTAFIVKD
jgi:FkbM family methyltransferase